MPRRGPRRARALLPLLVLVLTLVNVPAGRAGDALTAPGTTGVGAADLDAVLQQVRDELAESSEAMVLAAVDLRLAETALPGARETAARARRLLGTAQRRQEEAARLRGQAQVQLIISDQEAEASAAQVDEQRVRIGRIARAAYQRGGSMGEMSMLLEAQSPADFAERLVALQTVVSSQQSVLSDLRVVERSYGSRSEDLEQVRDVLATADVRAQRELREVVALEAQARAAETQVGQLVATRKAALRAAAAAQAADDAAIQHREAVTGDLERQLAAQAQAELGGDGNLDGSTVPARPGVLSWPVQGRVSSPFGMRVHPITGVYKLHTGTDLSVGCGTPIRAARDGVVVSAGWNSAYGWRTVVSHGTVDGVLLTTTYNHQERLGTQVGSELAAGEVLGTVGSTGYSTGCHLHLELYVNSSLVDPQDWLAAQ